MSAKRRFSKAVLTVLAGGATAALVAACTPATGTPDGDELGEMYEEPQPGQQRLEIAGDRESPGTVAEGGGDSPYNYAPGVMTDGARTRMWWCSQLGKARPAGDDVLYAEASSPAGPFRAPGGSRATAVFSGNPGHFDGVHTCDPSVVKVDGTYFMYYTGAAGDHAHGNAIGLATSSDGVTWQRANDGEPIVTPSYDRPGQNGYGVGQPSAVYLDGWFYLMFTDTTARVAGWNGAGQFVLRAKDPAFTSELQALGDDGFQPVDSTHEQRRKSVIDGFSADWMWIEQLGAFAIAHQTEHGTMLTFWDRGFTRNPYQKVAIPGPWKEGPGLRRTPEGHAPVSAEEPCGLVPIDVVRATRERRGAPTGLRGFGIDVRARQACADPERAVRVLDGFATLSPMRTVDLVVGGKLLRIDRRSVAEKLATQVLDVRIPALDSVPVAARLTPGVPAKQAADRGVGFLLGDTLWQVRPASAVDLNSSPIAEVDGAVWDSYPKGPVITGPE